MQASEKGYFTFRLEVHNKGGHSSLPERDNAIVRLAHALVAVHDHAFDARLTPVTRAYFERLASIETGAVAADLRAIAATDAGKPLDAAAVARLSALPFYNARLRTTCVPTRVQAGHADNALPQLATAIVNCRLLPGDSVDDVRRALETRDRRRRGHRGGHWARRLRPRLAALARALPGGHGGDHPSLAGRPRACRS